MQVFTKYFIRMKRIKLFIPLVLVFFVTTNFTWPPEKQFWYFKLWFSDFQTPKTGVNVGDVAPNIEMEGVDGKMMSLADLRGKVVLIDFWASWCGPCRHENPNVVEAYNKYKSAKFKDGKGFEVFSVSLDAYKEAWVKAIDQDKLTWKYHVCDYKKWANAAARLYKVNSIPTNVLIDANGVIIAKNLRGMDLHTEIDKIVVKL